MPLHIWTQRDYDSMHKIYTKSQDGVGKSAPLAEKLLIFDSRWEVKS